MQRPLREHADRVLSTNSHRRRLKPNFQLQSHRIHGIRALGSAAGHGSWHDNYDKVRTRPAPIRLLAACVGGIRTCLERSQMHSDYERSNRPHDTSDTDVDTLIALRGSNLQKQTVNKKGTRGAVLAPTSPRAQRRARGDQTETGTRKGNHGPRKGPDRAPA